MENPNILLRTVDYDEFNNLRKYRFSSYSLQYDDPNRPIPNEKEEELWWKEDVITNNHIILAIEDNGIICGVVNAFSFDRSNNSCEIGIEIYPQSNFNKGLGKKALGQFIEYLKNSKNVDIVKAETNIKNNAMINILNYFSFKKTSEYEENKIIWQCFEKKLN